jgi:hypothetical protein
MNQDPIKDAYKKIKAPNSHKIKGEKKMNTLVEKLKKYDQKTKRLLTVTKFFYLFLVVLLMGRILLPGPNTTLSIQISHSLFLVAFLLFVFFLVQKWLTEIKNLNYNLNTLEFLEQAKERLSLFNAKTRRIIIPFLVLVNAAGILAFMDKHWHGDFWIRLIVIELILLAVFGFGFLMGIIDWRKRTKPLYDEVIKMRIDLETINHMD